MANPVAVFHFLGRSIVFGFATALLFTIAACAQGTSLVGPVSSPDCTNADLAATLHVYRAPDQIQVIAIDYRNIKSLACFLRPDGGPKQGPPLKLEPDATAHTSFRWRTEPPTPEMKCRDQSFRTISVNRSPNGLMIVSVTMLPQVCSVVRYDPYFAGPFMPDWRAESGKPPVRSTVTLSAPKETYFQHERLRLKLTIDELSSQQPKSKYSCPVLFRTVRNSTGFTRIDETPTVNWQECKLPREKDGSLAKQVTFDKIEPEGSGYEQMGAQTFCYSQLTGYSREGELVLSESNPVTLHFEDPAVISRTWGKINKGVRVNLTLDKLTYTVGEDIPLHIAAQVVTEERPVYGEMFGLRGAFMSNFAASFQIVILDDDGPLSLNHNGDLIDYFSGSSGPSVCTGPLERGKVYPLERSAESHGFLPQRPGTYRIYVRWSPYLTKYKSCDEIPREISEVPRERPFVTVRSAPLTIHITGEGKVADGVPEVPEYTAWRRHFALVNTSFGEQTALLDKTTGLEWLRVNLTTGFNEAGLRKRMQPEGKFEGWRFARKDEVGRFFVDFTGVKNGASKDAGVEREMQRLLGGPTDTPSNEQTGWSRRATRVRIAGLTPAPREDAPRNAAVPIEVAYPCPPCNTGFNYYQSYIAEDTQNGQIRVTVDPGIDDNKRGWTDGDRNVNDIGFFLVHERR